MLQGFKDFISRGNAIEMAVGIIIGTAFGTVITAVTDKFIMPIVAGLVGEPNFDDVLAFHLNSSYVQPGAILTAFVNFLLVAAALYFVIVMPMNKLAERRGGGEEAEEPAEDVKVLTEIRDLLSTQR